MSSSTLDCPTIRWARKSTEETSRVFDKWKERRDKLCDGLNDMLSKMVEMVNAWKTASEMLTEANRANEIADYLQLGDLAFPHVVVAGELLTEASSLIDDADFLKCSLPNLSDFKIAVYEMGKVKHFFENWPRSDSEHVNRIREEFARGEFRDFQEFLREMQTRHHAAG